MCGVIGYYPIETFATQEDFADLLRESSIRGLHAFGIVQPHQEYIDTTSILHGPIRMPGMKEHRVLRSFSMSDIVRAFVPSKPALAHTRYCTSGDWRVLENNQPIVVGPLALVFNGVIHMGTKEEMEADHQVKLTSDNDGEIFLQCREDRITAGEFIAEMKGSFAGLWFDIDGKMYAGRNERRPLWWVHHCGAIWYASTRDIFLRAGFPEPVQEPVGVYCVPNR